MFRIVSRYVLVVVVLILASVLSACGGTPAAPTPTPAPPATEVIPDEAVGTAEVEEATEEAASSNTDDLTEVAVDTEPTEDVEPTEDAEVPSSSADDLAVLVWTAENAAIPGQQGASNPGQLALIDRSGTLTPIFEIPLQTRFVEGCGDNPTSPDRSAFVFFVGLDEGDLYLIEGQDDPLLVDNIAHATCMGSGTLRYSPDSRRLGYIDFADDLANRDFPVGFFRIYDRETEDFALEVENVTAFDLADDTAAFVNFFTNDQDQADEVAVQIWDGEADREVATLRPDAENCRFVSAALNYLPDGDLSLILGQRCIGTNASTGWQLYTVSPTARSATRLASADVPGGYQPFARTNVQFIDPNGSGLMFTTPDGITASTAGLFSVMLDDPEPTQVIERQVVMPGSTMPPNATPQLSPDGRWLALVETTPNAENTLRIFDLNDLTLGSINYAAGIRGDTVSAMRFTPDSQNLLAIVGGDEGDNNSLVSFELATGADVRVERGRFNRTLVISPDGTQIAVGNTQVLEDATEPPYLNLITLDLASTASTTLFEGAILDDEGKVDERRFAIPLAWR